MILQEDRIKTRAEQVVVHESLENGTKHSGFVLLAEDFPLLSLLFNGENFCLGPGSCFQLVLSNSTATLMVL